MAAIGLLVSRNLKPVQKLLSSFWKDWTLLSFAGYGALPLLLLAVYDESRNAKILMMVFILILVTHMLPLEVQIAPSIEMVVNLG